MADLDLGSTGKGSSNSGAASTVDGEKRKRIVRKLLSAIDSSNGVIKIPTEPFEVEEPERITWWLRTSSNRQFAAAATAKAQPKVAQASAASSHTAPSSRPSGKNAAAKKEDIEDDWLLSRIEELLVLENSTESPSEVETRVMQIIESRKEDDVLQNDLLELLGFSDFALNLIPQIVQNRSKLTKKRRNASKSRTGGVGRNDGAAESFIKGAKAGLVLERKALPEGTTREWLELKPVENNRQLPGTAQPSQPIRYEKVFVPATNRPIVQNEDLIPTSRFGNLARKAFEGIPTLNRLQSRLFHTAYETSENLLVCAPTGAGKTNVAMTTIAREIERLKNPRLVKCVYIAPMKALAQEVVDKFSQRLAPLRMQVKEVTGDTQLSRREMEQTQVIVTTPEKWDVITRKTGGDSIGEMVQLLIIDEVHLVGEDRGPVIEALVARTVRQVERKQQMVRIVGLSATLPNYTDVALFLRVNPDRGLFYFDSTYRPVPLDQCFVGVQPPTSSTRPSAQKMQEMLPLVGSEKKASAPSARDAMRAQKALERAYNELACQFSLESCSKGHQVMIFVHTRKDTSKTARAILDLMYSVPRFKEYRDVFSPRTRNMTQVHERFKMRVARSKNAEVQYLFGMGMGIHHAGMSREDRNLTEEMFMEGAIACLCCTATLAWGVNLPAHTVIVKGTEIYAPERGGACDLGSADVFQCFGRAGRPQFDTSGEAILLTEHSKLAHYLQMLTYTLPLESKLIPSLPDCLNAEIVSGTVASLDEASTWLSYTFLFVRMLRSPTMYGISLDERERDPHLENHRMKLIGSAVKELSVARMVKIGIPTEGHRPVLVGGLDRTIPLGVTDLGRIASHYYVHHETVQSLFNERLKPVMTFADLLRAVCSSKEFEQLKVREEERVEMKRVASDAACPFPIDDEELDNMDHTVKAFVLFQAYISRYQVDAFTLHSDMNYISQNAARIVRALFEVALARGWIHLSLMTLKLAASLERRSWWWPLQTPLRQLSPILISPEALALLGEQTLRKNVIELLEETPASLMNRSTLLSEQKAAKVMSHIRMLPMCRLEIVHRQPITQSLLRLSVRVTPLFTWRERIHGDSQAYYLFVDDGSYTVHYERLVLKNGDDSLEVTFAVPLFGGQGESDSYNVRLESDSGWLDCGASVTLKLSEIEMPSKASLKMLYTDLLDVDPLPVHGLKNYDFQGLYRFSHFNPVQTQCFHALYHRDESCIIGAPTGSGKTVLAELAVFRALTRTTKKKPLVVYVAPLKALVAERIADWREKFSKKLGKRIIELTGDASPSASDLEAADMIVATPEKFEVSTRFFNVNEGHFLHRVNLVIFDEVHLLGEDRGASLEGLVCRLKACRKSRLAPIRLVGLSTALANANDLGKWFQTHPHEHVFTYNFRPAVRVVPLEVHIAGFPGQHYCPRMASMNKPVYHAILKHSPNKPVLVFVASRRQTRLTAFDLIALCADSDNPRRFLLQPGLEDDPAVASAEDDALRHCLQFGIALHHAGLSKSDRELSERLFASNACQVLIATATLAWGVNLPAHLVIIKGTEYFEPIKRKYEPFPVTDVLQMMGRAGRPQYNDEKGIAVILIHDQLKEFYKRFLYEPFPLESNLSEKALLAFVNAEIAAGRVKSETEFYDQFLTETFLAVRLDANPGFYTRDAGGKAAHLMRLAKSMVQNLRELKCVVDDGRMIKATPLGVIAARFDLSPSSAYSLMNALKEQPMDQVTTGLAKFNLDSEPKGGNNKAVQDEVLQVCTLATDEFSSVPVRHSEDELNMILAQSMAVLQGSKRSIDFGSPRVKSFLLLKANMENHQLPIHDFLTDTKQVLDVAARVFPAAAEVCALAQVPVRITEACCRLADYFGETNGKRPDKKSGALRGARRIDGTNEVEVDVSGSFSSSWFLVAEAASGLTKGVVRTSSSRFRIKLCVEPGHEASLIVRSVASGEQIVVEN